MLPGLDVGWGSWLMEFSHCPSSKTSTCPNVATSLPAWPRSAVSAASAWSWQAGTSAVSGPPCCVVRSSLMAGATAAAATGSPAAACPASWRVCRPAGVRPSCASGCAAACVHRLRACLAPGLHERGVAAFLSVGRCVAVGAGSLGGQSPVREPDRRRPRRRVEHRQRRGPGRRPAPAHRPARPLGWRAGRRRRRTRLASHTQERQTRKGDKLRHRRRRPHPPVSTGTGPSRLLAMAEGRSEQAFKTWLAAQPEAWRDDILALFDHTGSSNGPTEVINMRSEYLQRPHRGH